MINKITELGYSLQEAKELIKVSKDINKDIELLKKKYPIQYLIGYVDFYGYKINVNKNVLIPRYETEYLIEKLIKYSNNMFNKKIDILDLCTGSGAIGIVLSKELDCNITLSDISKEALEVAKENVKMNNVNALVVESDLFSNLKDKYDIIVCNPPYISYDGEVDENVKLYEPNIALFADDNGLYIYKQIFKNINNYLKDKYIIAFEIGYDQGEILSKLSKEVFKDSKIIVEKDLSNRDRYLFIIHE